MGTKFNTAVFICLFLLFSFNIAFGQLMTMKVSKSLCSDKNSYFLEVEIKKNGKLLDSSGRKDYDYSNIYRLDDSVKIKIIEELLYFTSDTSLCCSEVKAYDNIDYPGCFNEIPSAKRLSVRVEALFIINRVAYNSFTYRIGCYPVLYDSETKREINNDNCLINIMIERYREWFRMYKKTGKLPDYQFLNEGRIRWWGKHLK